MTTADRSSGFRINLMETAFPPGDARAVDGRFKPRVSPVPGYGDGIATESHRVPGCPPGGLLLPQAGPLFKAFAGWPARQTVKPMGQAGPQRLSLVNACGRGRSGRTGQAKATGSAGWAILTKSPPFFLRPDYAAR